MSAIHHRACNLCEAMCGLEIEHHEGRVLAIRGDPEDPLSRGFLCVKAQALQEVYEDPDRLRHPLRRRGSDWEEVGWEEALDEIAARLLAVQARHGRDAVAVYMGNPTVHDYGAMIGGALLEASLGTASRYSASSVDQLPRMFVSRLLYGHQALLPVPDVDRTAWFLIVGANPVASNGSLMGAPGIGRRLAELRRRGGKVVVIDPRRTETAAMAGEHHFIRPGTDALLLLAMLQVIFAEGRSRPGRLAAFTEGLDELAGLPGIAARFPPERVSAATGIAAGEIRRLARELAEAPAAAPYGRVGACTQRFGGLTIWLLDALAIATGNLDREGGLLFARPAVNLAAGSRFGIGAAEIGRHRTRVRGLPSFGGQLPAIALAEEIDTPGPGRLRALLTIAGNPVLSLPDGGRLERALGGLELMVSIDLYLNETTRFADFILPAAQALEQDHYDLALHLLTVRNTARYSPPLFAPSAGVRPSWRILAGIAARLDRGRFGAGLKWRLLERLGPAGLLDLGLRLGPYGDRFLPGSRGLSLARLRRAPHGLDFGALAPRLPALLGGRRIDLVPEPLRRDLDRLEATLAEPLAVGGPGGLQLIGRRHLLGNNSWLHNSPRLVSGRDRCTLLMHPDDAAVRRLGDGDRVRVRSRTGAIEVPLAVSSRVMPGVVSLPHGYGHGRPGTRLRVADQHRGASINDLTSGELFDELTGNAGLNGTEVFVEPVNLEGAPPPGTQPAPG
jgi:anaerobic selenocysteine-containing dehydrogenase